MSSKISKIIFFCYNNYSTNKNFFILHKLITDCLISEYNILYDVKIREKLRQGFTNLVKYYLDNIIIDIKKICFYKYSINKFRLATTIINNVEQVKNDLYTNNFIESVYFMLCNIVCFYRQNNEYKNFIKEFTMKCKL